MSSKKCVNYTILIAHLPVGNLVSSSTDFDVVVELMLGKMMANFDIESYHELRNY